MVRGGVVTIGADSMANASCPYDLISSPKVFRVGDLIIGVSGSPRVTDIARYWFDPPAMDELRASLRESNPHRWMVRVFVPLMMATFQANDQPIRGDKD